MLCARGAQILQSKSINVEDAANELISMLCDVHEEEEPEEEDEEGKEAEDGKRKVKCHKLHSLLVLCLLHMPSTPQPQFQNTQK